MLGNSGSKKPSLTPRMLSLFDSDINPPVQRVRLAEVAGPSPSRVSVNALGSDAPAGNNSRLRASNYSLCLPCDSQSPHHHLFCIWLYVVIPTDADDTDNFSCERRMVLFPAVLVRRRTTTEVRTYFISSMLPVSGLSTCLYSVITNNFHCRDPDVYEGWGGGGGTRTTPSGREQ